MKILIVCDQHFGKGNADKNLLNNQKKFYDNVLFPLIDERGITTIIDLGDTFDKRQYVHFYTLDKANEMWFEPVNKRGMEYHVIAGNHTVVYKSTNKLNSHDSLKYTDSWNYKHYSEPTEITIDGTKILLLPWINKENEKRSLNMIKNSSASICMGHLELTGFEMDVAGQVSDSGLKASVFDKFSIVLSGHYHHKSNMDDIHYLGAPAQFDWGDCDDPRGVHIFDTDTLELEFIENPYNLYEKIIYNDEDNDYSELITDTSWADELEDKYIKVIVEKRKDQDMLDSLISIIENSGSYKVDIVNNHLQDLDEDTEVEVDELKDTVEIMKKYCEKIDKKKEVLEVLTELYDEAQELKSV